MIDPIIAGTAAYQTLSALSNSLGELEYGNTPGEIAENAYDRTKTVITSAMRDALVQSVVYFERNLLDDRPVLENLLNVVHQLYGGYVLTALGLDSMIGDVRVRDLLKRVSSESFMGADELANKMLAHIDPNVKMQVSTEAAGPSLQQSLESDSARLSSGKILEVTFPVGGDGGKGTTIKTNIFLQLLPQALEPEVAAQLITLNYSESLTRRWTKYKVGEISFWADFMFGVHEMKKLDAALRKDRSGVLVAAMKKRQNSLVRNWMSLLIPKLQTRNAATTVMLISKDTFDRACSDAGFNFKIAGQRQRFFNKSMMLMVAVVDPDYAMVDLYTNGLSQYGSYPFSSLERIGSKGASLDMKSLMAVLAQGQTPKF